MKKNKGLLARVAFFAAAVLFITGLLLAHKTLTAFRAVGAVLLLVLGTAAIVFTERCVERGQTFEDFLCLKAGKHKVIDLIAFTAVIAISIYVRAKLLYIVSDDNIAFFAYWVEQFRGLGIKTSLGACITDYSPLYTTILTYLSLLPLEAVIVTKIPAIVCDYVIAFFAALIYKEVKGKSILSSGGILTIAVMLLNPISVLNSAAWGGVSDSEYVVFIIIGVYFLVKGTVRKADKSEWAMVFFALAFAMKLQAVLILPVIICFWILGKREGNACKIRLSQFVWFPVVYLFTSVPMMLCGKPLEKVFDVYFKEVNEYTSTLNMNYPNFYCLIGEQTDRFATDGIVSFGIGITAVVMGLTYYFFFKKVMCVKAETILAASAATVLITNFFLPCMHERYAFAGEMLILIMACLYKGYFVPALATVICTLSTYGLYLFGENAFTTALPAWIIALTRLSVIVLIVRKTIINNTEESIAK